MGIIAGALVTGGYLGMVDGQLPIPLVGQTRRAHRDRAGHADRRLADHPHHGLEDHQAPADGRFRRRNAVPPWQSSPPPTSASAVSTTHTITGAIVGVGAIRRLSAVRWGVARRIVWAWLLTIPAAAAISALTYWAIAALVAP